MTILHVIGSMNPLTGGPCQGIRYSIPELEKVGVYREIVSLDSPDASFILKDQFAIHALGPARNPWCYSPKLFPWLLENLPFFDVVIVNGLWLYSSYAVWKAIRRLKKEKKHQVPKVYVMPHGMLDPYFQQAPERTWKAIRNVFYWKLIEHNVIRDADGILFTSDTELQLARQPFWPYAPKREVNVGYGIPAPPTVDATMRHAFIQTCTELGNRPYFLFLSRIHYKKGLDLLIKAYANLQQTESGLPALVIAGPGIESDYGQRLYQVVQHTPALREAVYFPGMLTGAAKWGALYGCEAFVLPSHQENFGIAVVEALACGKPVLISNQVNIWQEINTMQCGFVGDDTFDAIRASLVQWLNLKPTEKKAMGERALSTFENHFTIEINAQRFLNAIQS